MIGGRSAAGDLAALAVLVTIVGGASAQEPEKPAEPAKAAARPVKVSSLPEYTEGTYGTGTTTQILSVPLKLEWPIGDRLGLELTVPFLWERGRHIVAATGTGLVRVPERREGRSSARHTEAGLGDVLLEVSDIILTEKEPWPELTPYVEIKFPTADSSRGLGTGEFDETLGTRLSKSVGERWALDLDLAYTFVGSPSTQTLRNTAAWSVGASYDATSSLRLSSTIEGATRVSAHSAAPLDLRLLAEYTIGTTLQLSAGTIAGFSNGSPAFGVIAGAEWRF